VTVTVRPAGPADHDAAIAVWAASDTARRGSPSPPEVPQMLRERFARDDVWLLVADDDGVVIGVAQGAPARDDGGTGPVVPGRCHLSMVFVAPERWGEGIGSLLVDSAVAVAAGVLVASAYPARLADYAGAHTTFVAGAALIAALAAALAALLAAGARPRSAGA